MSIQLPVLKFIIGIKHGFVCINICNVPMEVLKTEATQQIYINISLNGMNVIFIPKI